MKIYFLSSQPCALHVNGAYFGLTDRFERFADVALKDNLFVQFSSQNALPVGFFLNENIRFSPPEGVEVYLLRDGIALYARDFTPIDLALYTHAQKRFGDLLVTLFTQGATQISIESPRGFFVHALSPALKDATIELLEGLIFLHTENQLTIFTQAGACVFSERISSFAVENGELSAVMPICDPLCRTAECRYALSENACERTACIFKQATSSPSVCPDDLLCYAFFQSVLLGADYERFLADELKQNAPAIREFLGEFESVIATDEPNVCALVRRKAERLFCVDRFTVRIENGRITDLQG